MIDVDELVKHCSKTLYCWKHADFIKICYSERV